MSDSYTCMGKPLDDLASDEIEWLVKWIARCDAVERDAAARGEVLPFDLRLHHAREWLRSREQRAKVRQAESQASLLL